MENEQPIDTNYQKGFNEGYLITKHLPELSDSIAKVENDTPRLNGFKDGKRQFVLEQTKSHRPQWMQINKENSDKTNRQNEAPKKDKDKDIDR